MKRLLCSILFITLCLSAHGKQPVAPDEIRLEVHRGHRSGIRSSDFSPDGKLLATCSRDHSIRLWSVASGKLVKILPTYFTLCQKLRFSPDGRSIGVRQRRVSNGFNGMLVLYDVYRDDPYYFIKKKNFGRFKVDSSNYSDFAFNPDGKTMAISKSFSNRGKLNIWDLRQQKIKYELVENPLQIVSRLLTYSPNGKLLAIKDGNNLLDVKIWDTATGRLKLTIKGQEQQRLKAITFDKNGDRIYVGRNYKIHIHSTTDGSLLKVIDNSRFIGLGFNKQLIHNNNQIIQFSNDGNIQLQNIDNEEIETIYVARYHNPTQIFTRFIRFDAFSEPMKNVHWLNNLLLKIKAETFLYFPSLDHEWNASRVKETIVTPGKDHTEKTHPYGLEDERAKRLLRNAMHSKGYASVARDIDKNLLSASTNEGSTHLWDLKNRVFHKDIKSDDTTVRELVFNDRDNSLLSIGHDLKVKQWGVQEPKPVQSILHLPEITAIKLDPKNGLIAEGTKKEGINVYQLDNQGRISLIRNLNANPNRPADSPFRRSRASTGLAISPKGRYLASVGHEEGAKVWSLADGSLYGVFKAEKDIYKNITFSSDGKYVSAISDYYLKTWHVASKKLKQSYEISGLYSISYHPRKNYLVAAGKSVVAWDLDEERPFRILFGHQDTIWNMVFSSDGKTLYTASEDKTVNIWDFERGKLIKTLRKGHAPVNDVALNKDETILAVASENIELWNLKTGRLIATLWSFDDNQWAVTQGKRFDVSENARHRINFFKNLEALPTEPYHTKFNNPDLLSKLFQHGTFSF